MWLSHPAELPPIQELLPYFKLPAIVVLWLANVLESVDFYVRFGVREVSNGDFPELLFQGEKMKGQAPEGGSERYV